jgi:hypothetical protein
LAIRPHVRWHVTGVDSKEKALSCLQSTARRTGTQDQITTQRAKVRRDSVVRILEDDVEPFHARQYDLISMIRFFERSIMSHLCRICTEGGFVLLYNFSEGVQKFGNPKSANLIVQPGELSEFFRKQGTFDVLVDVIRTLPDGRPMSIFLARKHQVDRSACSNP